MNVKCCMHVLHNVYQACCDVLLSTFDPRTLDFQSKQEKQSTNLLVLYLNMAFKKTKQHARVKSILHPTSHLHTEYCKRREKSSVCPMSCSGLCPTNLEDKSLMSRSAYRMQRALCLPETAVTSKTYCSLDNASCVLVHKCQVYHYYYYYYYTANLICNLSGLNSSFHFQVLKQY